jgi:hypothetical protein
MSVSFYQTKQCNIPEDSHLHPRQRENLISPTLNLLLQVATSIFMLPLLWIIGEEELRALMGSYRPYC